MKSIFFILNVGENRHALVKYLNLAEIFNKEKVFFYKKKRLNLLKFLKMIRLIFKT